MVCWHCKTELEEPVLTCTMCGATTGELMSPTDTTVVEGGEKASALPTLVDAGVPGAATGQKASEGGGALSGAGPGWTAAARTEGLDGALCLLPGVILGERYRILKPLGEGGMGSVYKAHDLEVDRVVALKIIKAELASSPLVLQRFKQELLLARKVTHPNVVRIFDLGVAGSLRFITMEYIEGQELSEVLRERKKLGSNEACRILLQVCHGLGAAHEQGVVHRDLKPQNIMVEKAGRVAVMDFGIARSADGGAEAFAGETQPEMQAALTRVGSLLGTPQYMSPEQARGETVDARSDIFSLGIIFFLMLTGQLPFNERTLREIVKTRGIGPAPDVQDLESTVPKRVAEMVRRCLEGKPENRYQSLAEVIADLETVLGIRKKAKRFTKWTAIAWTAALLGIAASGLLVRQRVMEERSRNHAPVTMLVSDFRNKTGNPILSGVVEPMLQLSLEGSPFITSFNRGQAHKAAEAIQPGNRPLDTNLARLVALRQGIGVVVGGSLERSGRGYQLFTRALDANGKVITEASETFTQPGELPKAVDGVAAQIRRVLGDSSAGSALAAETFTSGSLESAQKYAEAQQLQWSGKWEEAMAAYRQATKLDPKMSRAYAGLAVMLANRGQRAEAVRYYQMALANLSRESPREKLRTRGGYYLVIRDYAKAAEQYSDLLKQYPADNAAVANLALAYFYGRNMAAAMEQGRKAVALSPNNILQRNNLGLYAMYAGEFEEAIRESEAIIRMNPTFEKAYLCLGMSLLQKGDIGRAKQAYGKLAALSDWGRSEAALAEADLALFEGQNREAARGLEPAAAFDLKQKNAAQAGLKLVALGEAQLGSNSRGAAARSAAQAVEASGDDSTLFLAASVALQAGERGQAMGWQRRLVERFEPEPRGLAKLIEGEDLFLAGKLHEAIAALEESKRLADQWLCRYWLGRAYLAAKQYPQAENELDVCLRRRGEASSVFLDDEPTTRYLPMAYYYAGLARQALQNPEAGESLRTFLAMRQGGELNFWVADAQRRLENRQ